MYTLAIKTQNEECIKFLNKSFAFEKQYYCNEEESEVFEITHTNEKSANSDRERFTKLLKDFDDTDVWIYISEQEEGELLDDYINDKYFY